MKTGSKKQYRKHRSYVQRDLRLREEAVDRVIRAKETYRGACRINVNHLDPLLEEDHDQATENFIVLEKAQHDLLEMEVNLDSAVEKYEKVCEETGIDPRCHQFTD